ncbi:MAG TPA: YrdB family protein [Casimicrobiaceae bacterium]
MPPVPSRAVEALNLGLRFALELIGVGAVAYWGWSTSESLPLRLVLAIGAAAILIVLWSLIVAPKAANPIPQSARMLIGTGLLLTAAAGLAVAGQPGAALAFAIVVIVNQVLLFVLGGGEA